MQVSEIRWREPMFGPDSEQHTFKVGDRVRIARLADGMTTRDIIGHEGVLTDIDDIAWNSVEMSCRTCGGVHTMHEQELDFLGDDLVRTVSDKAGVMEEAIKVDQAFVNLEDFLAVAMHKAGFQRVSVQDKSMPASDPHYPKPIWSKFVYGFITKLAPFRVYHDALIKIAAQAGGYLAEWATYSQKWGYNSVIRDEDLDTLTLEMPIRALMVAKSTTEMGEYDEIKDMVAYWLQDAHQIDIGAIYRALRNEGFGMGHWNHEKDINAYKVHLRWEKADGMGQAKFIRWAEAHWEWVGTFTVYVHDEGKFGHNDEIEIKKADGAAKVTVEEFEDVPF